MQQKTPYELIGGEKAVASLVDRFYFFMDTMPEAAGIRALHRESLAEARDKLFKYLSGWLGGPDLFVREYGHPRLRARHFPVAIGVAERDQWLLCMARALDEIAMPTALRRDLSQALQQLATHMINQES
ncbi:MAG: globin [Gammaproteobacteria bacterium HGW-Gammaproteobacteria-3]|jgi:hemoglobin|nr:MAG: globin [Gammaproteobacteria bacterium HGW-Gammaproteobacteria-3]